MRVTVLYFAVFRERLGRDGETVELPDGATTDALIAALEARHDAVRGLRGRYRIAVNHEMTGAAVALGDGDEVALIPPVAGGSQPRLARLVDQPPSLDRVVDAVRGEAAGGLVTFTGMVRRHSHGAR